ncbi:MAG: hypothetical protein KKA81_04685 [Bacteroidetes bacterium]|nr:hypothetical protein [Bacteroidota bacterium]
MRISRNNYEEHFLSYLEGQLTQEEVAQLQLFLAENPDLELELNKMGSCILKPDKHIKYPFKQSLKVEFIASDAEINQENLHLYCIAFLENELSPADTGKFRKYLGNNPEANALLNSFRQIKLTPETEIHFHGKKSLKKTSGAAMINFSAGTKYFIKIAAVFLLLAGTGALIWHTGQKNTDRTQNDNIFVLHPKTSAGIELSEQIAPPPPAIRIELANLPEARNGYTISRIQFQSCSSIKLPHTAMPPIAKTLSADQLLAMDTDISSNNVQTNENPKSKTLVGKILRNLSGKISNRLDPAKEIIDFDDKEKITFWDVAESGIKGYNFLTNNDYELVREVNKNGKTRFITIQERDEINIALTP